MLNVYFTFINDEERQVLSDGTFLYYLETLPRIGETVLIGKTSKLSSELEIDIVMLNSKDVFEYEGGTVVNVVHNIIECDNTDNHRIDIFVKRQIKGGKP